jgi:hypothetical protein
MGQVTDSCPGNMLLRVRFSVEKDIQDFGQSRWLPEPISRIHPHQV